jgi:hypothetical protein
MATVEGYYSHPHVRAQLYPDLDAAQHGTQPIGYVHVAGLGGVEDDVKRNLSLIPGASGYYGSLVTLIQQKAKEGAEQAIPRIKSEVEATVKPYVYAAFLLGLGGFLFGISTYLSNRKAT